MNTDIGLALEDVSLIGDIRHLLAIFHEGVESMAEIPNWTQEEEVWWNVLLRCVLLRQHESMETVVDLVEKGRGHCCIPLLRPACEELLWIKYLATLSKEDRALILEAKIATESGQSLVAQAKYVGEKGMVELGFEPSFLVSMREQSEFMEGVARQIGKRLGWRSRRVFPTAAYIAEKVKEKQMYDLIFHATSSIVSH